MRVKLSRSRREFPRIFCRGNLLDTVRCWIRDREEIQAINLGGPAGYRISQGALDGFTRERTTIGDDQ
jgi:hypothetical protein